MTKKLPQLLCAVFGIAGILSLATVNNADAQRFVPGNPKLNSVTTFNNSNQITVVGDTGTLLYSSDGGRTWVKDSMVTPTKNNLRSVVYNFAAGNGRRALAGDTGVMMISENTGSARSPWRNVVTGTTNNLRYVHYNGGWWGGQGFTVGDSGTIIAVRDNGLNTIRAYDISLPIKLNYYCASSIQLNTDNNGIGAVRLLIGSDSGKVVYLNRTTTTAATSYNSTFEYTVFNFDSLATAKIVGIERLSANNANEYFAYAANGTVIFINLAGTTPSFRRFVVNPTSINGACTALTQINATAYSDQAWNVRWNFVAGNGGRMLACNTASSARPWFCGNSGTLNNLNGITIVGASTGKPMLIAVGDNGIIVSSVDSLAMQGTIKADGPTEFCKGLAAVTLRDTTGGGHTYRWFKNRTAIANSNSPTYLATDTGTYNVQRITFDFLRVLNNNNNWGTFQGADTNSNTVRLRFLPAPARPTVSAISSDSIMATSDTLALKYQWFLGTSPLLNDTSALLKPTQTGNYRVIAYSANGCISDTSSPYPFQVCSEITRGLNQLNDTTLCRGSNFILRYTPPTNVTGLQYQWFRSGQQVSGTMTLQTVVDTGSYYVRISKANCVVFSDTINVRVSELPTTPTITNTGSLNICSGDSVILEAPTGFNNYRWTVGASATVVANSQTFVVKAATAGIRVRTVNADGCASAQSTPVTVNLTQRPAKPVITAAGATLTANLTPPTSGATFRWFKDGVLVTGATTASIMNAAPGVYRVVAVSSNNLCVSDTSEPLSVLAGLSQKLVADIKVYPNPTTNGELNIVLPEYLIGEVTISITDLQGKEVQSSQSVAADLRAISLKLNLAKGAYLMKLSSAGQYATKKVFVQ